MNAVNTTHRLRLKGTVVKESRSIEAKRLQAFFEAEAEAGMYDDTVELVVPLYTLAHSTLIELLCYHFGVTTRGVAAEAVTGTVLDIGSGTGMESIGILRMFPNLKIVGLDLCEAMHARFRENYKKAFGSLNTFEERCTLVQDDFLGTEVMEALFSAEPSERRAAGYQVVVSAFTLHHMRSHEKQEAYRRIYAALIPGGIMVNADLFNYQSPTLTYDARSFDNQWITKQFDHPDPTFAGAQAIAEAKRVHMASRWLKHYTEDNRLDPVEAPDAVTTTSIGKLVQGQMSMLHDIGFREAGCPFRYWQVGILWGKK